ncbi:MAG: 2,3,4,5-tetrahydropyridine-2,6-dicarboxylate N-succinyltransferase [Candidatus Nanohaloarchaea archaeon]|nr:2,3,4,5-tetrahydropyridine-2,6-dicarboxylate N-succinyltransferase [Candidatus Nanohaloarchaea archaeon]
MALWDRYENDELDSSTAGGEEYSLLDRFLEVLEEGDIRAAAYVDGGWATNEWVKKGILLNFGLREMERHEYGGRVYNDVLPLRDTEGLKGLGSRNTPSASVIRRGAAIGRNCILMSPCYVNIGARIGDGSLVDSCDTIGSCPRVGSDVKIGANTVIGGVLEPVEETPVVIEDDVDLGAGCTVTSGFVVREGCVVGENTLLSPRIPVYDLVEEDVLYGELPAGRKAFKRFVPSSLGQHSMFEEGCYKPAVVAVAKDAQEGVQHEEVLRDMSARDG